MRCCQHDLDLEQNQRNGDERALNLFSLQQKVTRAASLELHCAHVLSDPCLAGSGSYREQARG